MCAVQYRVEMTDRMSSDLLEFLKHRQHLSTIVEASLHCQPASSVWAFSAHVAKQTGLPLDDTRSVLHVLWTIRRGQEVRSEPADAVLEAITKAIKERAEQESLKSWTNEHLAAWDETREALKAALEQTSADSPLMISSKAQSLAYRHANVLSDSQIVADIRPVFDKSAGEVLEMVVTHTLIIGYSDDAGNGREIHLTMDSTDVEKLREQCVRAETKAKLIVDSLDKLPWRTVIFPESDAT